MGIDKKEKRAKRFGAGLSPVCCNYISRCYCSIFWPTAEHWYADTKVFLQEWQERQEARKFEERMNCGECERTKANKQDQNKVSSLSATHSRLHYRMQSRMNEEIIKAGRANNDWMINLTPSNLGDATAHHPSRPGSQAQLEGHHSRSSLLSHRHS